MISPMVGKLLINADAALFKTSQSMGVGIVGCDHSGNYIVAHCDKFPNVTDLELSEALAVRRALSFARDEGLDN
jgi:hypothetical protein